MKRSAKPTEYVSVYETLGEKVDKLEIKLEKANAEIATLISRTLTAEARLATLQTTAKRIALPVVCQNGHKNLSHYRFDRQSMDFVWQPPLHETACRCPKSDMGQGYKPDGDPYVVEDRSE